MNRPPSQVSGSGSQVDLNERFSSENKNSLIERIDVFVERAELFSWRDLGPMQCSFFSCNYNSVTKNITGVVRSQLRVYLSVHYPA